MLFDLLWNASHIVFIISYSWLIVFRFCVCLLRYAPVLDINNVDANTFKYYNRLPLQQHQSTEALQAHLIEYEAQAQYPFCAVQR